MKLNENQKITLTLGQLKKLVMEERKFDPSHCKNDAEVKFTQSQMDNPDFKGFYGIDKFIEIERSTIGGYSWDDEIVEKFMSWVAKKHPEYLKDEWYSWDWVAIRDEFEKEAGISWDDDEEEKEDQYFKVQYDGSDCAIIVWDADSNKFRVAQIDDDLDSNIRDDIRRVRNISYFYDTTPNALLGILDHHLGSLGYGIYPMSTEDALARLED